MAPGGVMVPGTSNGFLLRRKNCATFVPSAITRFAAFGSNVLKSAGEPPLSSRQLFAGLLRHHVGGVPVGPVCIALPDALLVLAVGSFRTPKGARQIGRRSEIRRRGVD